MNKAVIDKTNWCISEYTNISEIDNLKQNIQNIKIQRLKLGKSVDFSIMTHITRCIGGKMVKRGLITEKELENIVYFDIQYLELENGLCLSIL